MTQVESTLAATVSLPDFLADNEVGRLTLDERRLIVRQALLILEQNYALLAFKVARYGINPLQRLRLLDQRLARQEDDPGREWHLHQQLVEIFNSLRDLHTRYTLPAPFNGAGAYVPFLLKEFVEGDEPRYLVGRLQSGQPEIGDGSFGFGVEVTHWNGVPIERAIQKFADCLPGANPEARHARAVSMFTVRSLAYGPPPEEEWIMIRYVDRDGQAHETRQVWSVVPIATTEEGPVASIDTPLGVDAEGAQLAWLRAALFAPQALEGTAATGGIVSEMPTVFEARQVPVGDRTVGHLRIRTFMPTGSGVLGFVREFIRLLGELPQDGLVLDIRGNGGGAVLASEMCLQALLARPVEPEPAQFAATALNLRIARQNDQLKDWRKSLDQALDSGALYSAGIPLTGRDMLEVVPQSYFGPIVLLTDARCYSAADIFAAGFQDNGIGWVLGTDNNTGAGGGNIWQLGDLLARLPEGADSPYRPLPYGAGLSLVIRRVLRVGANAGTPLEDYGVVPRKLHRPTRRDVLEDDADLFADAVKLLAELPTRRFDVTLAETAGHLTAAFTVQGIDRADVIVDGRPRCTTDLGHDEGPLTIPGAPDGREVKLLGYDHGELVALRTFTREPTGLKLRKTLGD
ncbi:S41 family peptidase [Actinoplanes sp. NPDC049596]|uniref:S41 family peptidase n=1 Tax=unclassified Actinoplanes TaxID=2626549 RepID=UPI003414D99A